MIRIDRLGRGVDHGWALDVDVDRPRRLVRVTLRLRLLGAVAAVRVSALELPPQWCIARFDGTLVGGVASVDTSRHSRPVLG